MFGLSPARFVSNISSATRRIHAEHGLSLELAADSPVLIDSDECILLRATNTPPVVGDRLEVKVMGKLLTLRSLESSPLGIRLCIRSPSRAVVAVPPDIVCQVVEDIEDIRLLPGSRSGLFFVTAFSQAALLCNSRWVAAIDEGDTVISFRSTADVDVKDNDASPFIADKPVGERPPAGALLQPSDATVARPTGFSASEAGAAPSPLDVHDASTAGAAATLTDVYILHDATSCPINVHALLGAVLWQRVVREAFAALNGLTAAEAAALNLATLPRPRWTFVYRSLMSAAGAKQQQQQPLPPFKILAEMRVCGGFSCVDAGENTR